MFSYLDPTDSGFLQEVGAADEYGRVVDSWHRRLLRLGGSAFARPEAFTLQEPGTETETARIDWKAFPITAPASPDEIDRSRFRFQDEYVEWRVERRPDGSLARVTFSTEFIEYFEALARVGAEPLKREIANLYPGADPADTELFGGNFDPEAESAHLRAERFREHLAANPWNNGEQGILCLTNPSNSLGALFNLLGHCGIPRPEVNLGDVCASVGGFCAPNRSSDPRICRAVQGLARRKRCFCPLDPCGVRIVGLEDSGFWTVAGEPVDINDEAANGEVWNVTRNGRRAVMTFERNVRFAGAPILSGAQLSGLLVVAAEVVHAPEQALPAWAHTGQEEERNAAILPA